MQINPWQAPRLSSSRMDDYRHAAAVAAVRGAHRRDRHSPRARAAAVRRLGEALVVVGLRLAGPDAPGSARLAGTSHCG